MNATFAIWSNALGNGGMYLMFGDEKGIPYCPICESEKHGSHKAEWWFKNAADEQYMKAKSLGLIIVN